MANTDPTAKKASRTKIHFLSSSGTNSAAMAAIRLVMLTLGCPSTSGGVFC
jgi:hypothetical protein